MYKVKRHKKVTFSSFKEQCLYNTKYNLHHDCSTYILTSSFFLPLPEATLWTMITVDYKGINIVRV